MKDYRRSASIRMAMLALVTTLPAAASGATTYDPAGLIRRMCDVVASLKQFSFRADIAYDVIGPEGKKTQDTFVSTIRVRRPDRLRVDAKGKYVDKRFYYDGRFVTLYDVPNKVYATFDAPADIEGALAKAHDDFNLTVALTDLASAKLYEHLAPALPSARYLGRETVNGMPCHHIGLERPGVAIELWIDAGSKPLLRKVTINERELPQTPRWTATLKGWDTSAQLNDKIFTFKAPAQTRRIRFLPASKGASTAAPSPVHEGAGR